MEIHPCLIKRLARTAVPIKTITGLKPSATMLATHFPTCLTARTVFNECRECGVTSGVADGQCLHRSLSISLAKYRLVSILVKAADKKIACVMI